MSDSEMSVGLVPHTTPTYSCKVTGDQGNSEVVVVLADAVVNDAQSRLGVARVNDQDLDNIYSGSERKEEEDGDSDSERNQDTVGDRPWCELTLGEKFKKVTLQWLGKPLAVITLLYFFICSLNLLSSAFRLIGGKAAGSAFSSSVLIQNPVAGLMIGILSTVLVQSSSTSTSIVVAMVSSGIISVRPAIPIIMGANIGTSVTNTIVSLAQSNKREQFELAFAGATVHDMFNWLAVIVLLPLEVFTGCLYHLTSVIVNSRNFTTVEGGNTDFLNAITKPLTNLIVQLDKDVIKKLALGHEEYQNKSLLKQWCQNEIHFTEAINSTATLEFDVTGNDSFAFYQEPKEPCVYLLKLIPLSDGFLGLILMVASLVILCVCLVLIVRILNSSLGGPVAGAAQRLINNDLPGRFSVLTGYLAMIAGAGLTVIVQSSSVFTSTLTPLVGAGVISLERMYPLTLGANIGTTTTGLIAAMAAGDAESRQPALQIALVHLSFNMIAIFLFYPIPFTRFPVPLARQMGRTTAKYRWFAIAYLVGAFFLLPGALFALSMAGGPTFIAVICPVLAFLAFLITVNILKKCIRACRLPGPVSRFLHSLPLAFYSLAPLDNVIQTLMAGVKKVFSSCCRQNVDKMSEAADAMLQNGSICPDEKHKNGENHNSIDEMTPEQLQEYESTVRSLEEVKIMLASDVCKSKNSFGGDSGYVTQIHTPYLSKYPSRESFNHT